MFFWAYFTNSRAVSRKDDVTWWKLMLVWSAAPRGGFAAVCTTDA
jgi:hypothetical protein